MLKRLIVRGYLRVASVLHVKRASGESEAQDEKRLGLINAWRLPRIGGVTGKFKEIVTDDVIKVASRTLIDRRYCLEKMKKKRKKKKREKNFRNLITANDGGRHSFELGERKRYVPTKRTKSTGSELKVADYKEPTNQRELQVSRNSLLKTRFERERERERLDFYAEKRIRPGEFQRFHSTLPHVILLRATFFLLLFFLLPSLLLPAANHARGSC